MPLFSLCLKLSFFIFLLLLLAHHGNAQTYWESTIGNWNDSRNWNNGVPNAATDVFIQNSGTAVIDVTTGAAAAVGIDVGPGALEVIDGGNLTYNFINVGFYGGPASVLIQNSGVQETNPGYGFTISPACEVVLSEGGLLQATSVGSATAGNPGGTFAFDGGTLQCLASGLLISQDISTTLSENGGTIDTNSQSDTISSAISGPGGLTITGGGTLTLTPSSNSTYSGTTTIAVGTTFAQLGENLFSANSDVTIASGAQLNVNGFDSSIGALNGSGTVTNSGTTLGIITIGNTNSSGTFMGSLVDGTSQLSLTKVGTGTETFCAPFTGANTYTGTTTVTAGVLTQCGANRLSASSDVLIESGATLDLGGYQANIGALLGTGTVTNSGDNSAILTIGFNNNSGTFEGSITNGPHAPTGLNKGGTGTQTLIGTNTYCGNTSILGVLIQGSSNAFSACSDMVVETGGTLDLGGYDAGIGALYGFPGSIVTNSGSDTATLTLGLNNHTGTFAGSIQDGSGTTALTKTGSGTQAICGNNTYSGTTTINQGELTQCGANGLSPHSDVHVASGATLDSGGLNTTIGALNGSGTVQSSGGSTGIFTIGNTNRSGTFTGAIQDGSGTTALTKTGSGTQAICGNNTYSGTTTISQGELTQCSANGFSPHSDVNVASGAQLNVNGFDSSIGALNGSGTVTNNGMNAGILTLNANNNGIFNGVIKDGSSPLGLTKNGPGKETLNGDQAYTGITTINQGELAVNGQLASANVIVNPNGILSGVARYAQSITNAGGLVSPGNDGIGTINAENYTQSSNGTLLIEAASIAFYDQLIIEDTATLNGTLEFQPLEGFSGSGELIIVTAEQVNGEFSKLQVDGELRSKFGGSSEIPNYKLKYTDKSVLLIVSGEPIPSPSGSGLTSQVTPPDPFTPQLSKILDDSGNQSAGVYGGNIATTFNMTNLQYGQMTNQLASIRAGLGRGYLQQNLSQEPMIEQFSAREARGAKKQIVALSDEFRRWDIFAMASGIFSRMSSPYDLPRANSSMGYFSVGADYSINKNMNAGIYLGYQVGKTSLVGSWIKDNAVKFGFYSTAQWQGLCQWDIFSSWCNFLQKNTSTDWNISWNDNFYINGIIGGGVNFYNLNRSIHQFTYNRIARGHPTGGELDSLLGGGYEFNISQWRFGINNSIQYTYLGISSFTEFGARNLNLKVGSQTPSSLLYSLGASVSYLWQPAPGYQILPTVGLSWQHEFLNYSQNIGVQYANGIGPTRHFSTLAAARNNAFGVAGITAQLGTNWVGYAYYNPQFGSGVITSQGVVAGLTCSF